MSSEEPPTTSAILAGNPFKVLASTNSASAVAKDVEEPEEAPVDDDPAPPEPSADKDIEGQKEAQEEAPVDCYSDGWHQWNPALGRWGWYYVYKSYRATNAIYAALSWNAIVAVLSINAVFCILGCNALLSILSVNSALSILSVNSFCSIGCLNSAFKVCISDW
ncbi:hypothetical protein ACHAXT_004860 [Thalassiosira profunda]